MLLKNQFFLQYHWLISVLNKFDSCICTLFCTFTQGQRATGGVLSRTVMLHLLHNKPRIVIIYNCWCAASPDGNPDAIPPAAGDNANGKFFKEGLVVTRRTSRVDCVCRRT